MNDKKAVLSSGSAAIIEHVAGQEIHAITAAHVVADCDGSLYIRHSKRYKRSGDHRDIEKRWFYKVDVLASDKDLDLAVIKTQVKIAQQFPSLKISKKWPYTGQLIYVSGYPAPFVEYLVTKGIISSDIKQKAGNKYPRYLVTDSDLYYGNSGGPAVNEDMELIGVVSAMASGSGRYRDIEGPVRGLIIANDTIWQFFRENKELHVLYYKLYGIPAPLSSKVK